MITGYYYPVSKGKEGSIFNRENLRFIGYIMLSSIIVTTLITIVCEISNYIIGKKIYYKDFVVMDKVKRNSVYE